jgi:predicted small lipoprotein YifL
MVGTRRPAFGESVIRLVLCFTALLPLAMTAACGQKGALYLPPRNGTVVTRPAGAAPAPTPPAPATTEDKKDDNPQAHPK